MSRLIIEGEPSKLAIIRNRFRGLGVKFIEEEATENEASEPVDETDGPSEDESPKRKKSKK